MNLQQYVKDLNKQEIDQLAEELRKYVQGRPSLGLRMQDDFPQEFFALGDELREKYGEEISQQQCLSALNVQN